MILTRIQDGEQLPLNNIVLLLIVKVSFKAYLFCLEFLNFFFLQEFPKGSNV